MLSPFLHRLGPMARSSLLRAPFRYMTTSKPHGPSHQRGELLEEPPRNLKDLTFSLQDGIATITLDRPHRLNALSEDMGESLMRLCEYLTAAPADKVRACIVTGGPRAFSTGRDLKDSKLHTTLAQREKYMKLALESVLAVHRLVRPMREGGDRDRWCAVGGMSTPTLSHVTLHSLRFFPRPSRAFHLPILINRPLPYSLPPSPHQPLPTIAALSGPAFGWGLELALACDVRISSPSSLLCLPETSLGIFPGAGGVVLLRELVSPSIAKDLIFTARRFSGMDALGLGVVNRVSPEVDDAARELAEVIARNGPLGVRGAKEVMEGAHNVGFAAAMRLASQLRAPLSETDDFKEALQAFEEKRKPVFKGR